MYKVLEKESDPKKSQFESLFSDFIFKLNNIIGDEQVINFIGGENLGDENKDLKNIKNSKNIKENKKHPHTSRSITELNQKIKELELVSKTKKVFLGLKSWLNSQIHISNITSEKGDYMFASVFGSNPFVAKVKALLEEEQFSDQQIRYAWSDHLEAELERKGKEAAAKLSEENESDSTQLRKKELEVKEKELAMEEEKLKFQREQLQSQEKNRERELALEAEKLKLQREQLQSQEKNNKGMDMEAVKNLLAEERKKIKEEVKEEVEEQNEKLKNDLHEGFMREQEKLLTKLRGLLESDLGENISLLGPTARRELGYKEQLRALPSSQILPLPSSDAPKPKAREFSYKHHTTPATFPQPLPQLEDIIGKQRNEVVVLLKNKLKQTDNEIEQRLLMLFIFKETQQRYTHTTQQILAELEAFASKDESSLLAWEKLKNECKSLDFIEEDALVCTTEEKVRLEAMRKIKEGDYSFSKEEEKYLDQLRKESKSLYQLYKHKVLVEDKFAYKYYEHETTFLAFILKKTGGVPVKEKYQVSPYNDEGEDIYLAKLQSSSLSKANGSLSKDNESRFSLVG